MKDAHDKQAISAHGGHRDPAGGDAYPTNGDPGGPVDKTPDASSEWSRIRNGLKTKWVASVLAFWVSASVLGVVFFIKGELDVILSSIALGMLVIGVWLKTRYQLHLRKEPGKH